MVIQRIQTLYLLLAAILIASLCFVVPIATMNADGVTTTLYMKDFLPMLVLNMIIAALLIIAIFLYGNLKLQMKVTLLGILLIVLAMGIFGYIANAKMPVGAEVVWLAAAAVFIATVILAALAYKGMKSDKKKLSYDRLWK